MFNRRLVIVLIAAICAVSLLGVPRPAYATTFEVTSIADSGVGTLRAAIDAANSTLGADIITFNIAGGGPHVINLLSPLPLITSTILIDGWSEPSFNPTTRVPVVVLDGTNAGTFTSGFIVTGTGSTIRGLAIQNFTEAGVLLTGAATGNKVQGCYIGLSVDGITPAPNVIGVAMLAGTTNNLIGTDGDGTDDAYERNIISGNTTVTEEGLGIQIGNIGTDGNRVAGNYIGTDPTGTIAIKNDVGIAITAAAKNNIIGTNGDGVGDSVEGNVISGHASTTGNGIGVQISGIGTMGNRVAGNRIGLNAAGTAALSNNVGVIINSGATNNVVGTNGDGNGDAAEGNIISGNSAGDGVGIQIRGMGTSNNRIAGNWVGLNAAGNAAIPNNLGIIINTAATNNIVGTNGDFQSDDLERNVIAGNTTALNEGIGVQIGGTDTAFNKVAGNYIGLAPDGDTVIGNNIGIVVNLAASNNIIGTDGDGNGDVAERNVIAGNVAPTGEGIGVQISGAGTTGNRIAGNYIGINATATASRPNNLGVIINAGATNNIIGTNGDGTGDTTETNVISGHTLGDGIAVQIGGVGTSNNRVAGNFIGVTGDGLAAIGNGIGIVVNLGATNNIIGTNGDGTSDLAERNIIAGNVSGGGIGIQISSAGTSGNRVAGNFIGLNVNGTTLGNGVGIVVNLAATGNVIGTNGDGSGDTEERNIISGNLAGEGIGIQISGAGTSNNRVAGNYIGLNEAGTAAVANKVGVIVNLGATNNIIGTNGDGLGDLAERNLISGHNLGEGIGIQISGAGTTGNRVSGNWVGLKADGTALGNYIGVIVNLGATNNVVGTNGDNVNDAVEGNVVSGNALGSGIGVQIGGTGTTGNRVAGNLIGLNTTGTAAIGNGTGVLINTGAQNNIIGTNGDGVADAAERNVISGQTSGVAIGVQISGAGTNNNRVAGNYIGLNAAGTAAVGNAVGVNISGGAQSNIIGTNGDGFGDLNERNVISGNTAASTDGVGVLITATGASNNIVAGNYIGLNAAGTAAIPNNFGVAVTNGATNNFIGTNGDGVNDLNERNIISGNLIGVQFTGATTNNNRVAGNYIGTNAIGTGDVGNTQNGIVFRLAGSGNVIGGSPLNAGNRINYNKANGILLVGSSPTITQNTINNNTGAGIYLRVDFGANSSPATANDDTPSRPTIGSGTFTVQKNTIDGNCSGGATACAGIYAVDTSAANVDTLSADNLIGTNNAAHDIVQRWYGALEIMGTAGTPIASAATIISSNGGPTYDMTVTAACTAGVLNNTILHGTEVGLSCTDVTTWTLITQFVVNSAGTRINYTTQSIPSLFSTYSFDANAATNPTNNGEGFDAEGIDAPVGLSRYQIMQGGLPKFSASTSPIVLNGTLSRTLRQATGVSNIGTAGSTLKLTVVANSNPSVFTLTNLPLNVLQGQTGAAFTVTCVPGATVQTGTLTIRTNEAGKPTYTYSLTCRAAPETIGVYRPSVLRYYLRNSNSAGSPNFNIRVGLTGDVPLVGDWDGNGTSTYGVWRPSSKQFILFNSNVAGAPIAAQFSFGLAGDIPVVGDWDGDGIDGIGVFRPSTRTFYLRNALSSGIPSNIIVFGLSTDLPLIGDWNGDKIDSPGVFRPSSTIFYVSNTMCPNCNGTIAASVRYGLTGDRPFVGDWDGDGVSGIGVFRPSNGTMYLRNSATTAGAPNFIFAYGLSGDIPLAGIWASGAPADEAPTAPSFVPRN